MRTTLDIEEDVLQAAKELAEYEGTTAGKVLSRLARLGLKNGSTRTKRQLKFKNGVPVLPSRGEVITMEHIQRIMDEEGI